MTKMICKQMLLLAMLSIYPTMLLYGQAVSTAQVYGVVRDPSGAPIPDAEVKAIQTATGTSRVVRTDGQGAYSLNPLPTGPYRIEVSRPGFATYIQQGLVLEVGASAQLNPELKIGAVTEQVMVESSAPLVETAQVGVGQVIDQKRIEELPLNGRQATQLITLAGATTPAPASDLNTSKNFPTVTISVTGGQSTGITFLLDGANHNDPFNNLNLPLPMPDALQEFKAETSALPAQYGYHAVAAVNAVTRSGTNQFHGVLFDFFRNGALNARDTFATVRDNLKRNQFGGSLGGPIIRDRLFFFAGYQGTITRTSGTSSTTLPTSAMLGGDFTTFESAACNGGTAKTLKAPFVGNKILPSQFNQQSLNLLKYIPVSSDPCGAYVYTVPNNSSEHQGAARVDFTLNSKHTIFAREFIANFDNPPYWDGVSALTTTKAGTVNRVYSTTVGDTYIFSQNLINQFRATLNRTNNQRTVAQYFSPADLGVQIATLVPKYTNLSVTGSFSLGGGATNAGHFNTTASSVSDDLLWTVGKHQIGAGILYIHAITNTSNSQYPNGSFAFSTNFTGLGIADFMLGDIATFGQGNYQIVRGRLNYTGLYIDDVYKITPKVTVSYGLRWDPLFPTYTPDGHDMHFSMADFNAGIKSKVYVNAPAGFSYPGDSNFTAGRLSNGPTDKANFAPRVGFAWSPRRDGKTSIRGSYGIFYDLPTMFNESRFASAAPWGATLSLTPSATGSFTNPYTGYPGGNPFPALFNNTGSNALFPLAGALLTFPAKTQATYINQYNVSVQQQLFTNWVVKVEYLGNTTIHQAAYQEINPSVYIPGTSNGTNGSCGPLTTVQGLPAVGQPCSSTSNANNRRVLSLANYTEGKYVSTLANQDTGGTAGYNGLLASVQHRLANNFSILVNYTYSKCISDPVTHELSGDGAAYSDPTNRRFDRGRCVSDVRHIANMSGVFQSPKLGSSEAMRYITGDWQFSPIVTMRSAGFFTVTTGTDTALNGISNVRALLNGNPVLAQSIRSTAVNGRITYLNTSAFSSPATGTLGNPPAVNSIPGPKYLQFDMALSRVFPFHEGKQQIEFRGEAFNVLNRVNYNNPTATLSSGATFGVITSDSNSNPRILQLAIKIRY